MDKNELISKIEKVFGDGNPYGLEVFTVLKDGKETIMKKFLTTDQLNDRLSDLVKNVVRENYLSDDIELDAVDNISDNKKNCIYEIKMTDSYSPFSFIKECYKTIEQYDQNDSKELMGFLFRLNFNDNHFWAYQQVYPVAVMKKKSRIIAIRKDKIYDELKADIISIGSRIDLLIIDDSIITGKIGLLQRVFGFDRYIRKEAMETINLIFGKGLVKNINKLIELSEKEKLTYAKKLMKAKKSPVLGIEKTDLFNKITNHPRYKTMIIIENDEIKLKTQKDVDGFLKLLNDDIVVSELTGAEYDSVSKKALDPI